MEELVEQLLDWVRNRYFGKYRGVVTDNADPTSRGRLKVRVPAVLGELETWAMPCVPYAGSGVGFYSLPEAGTGVWVEFEAGDPSYPIWTGFFWADGELPDASDAAIKIWKTESLTLRMDDSADETLMENTSGSSVTIASDVVSESGGATHTVGSAGVVSEAGTRKAEVTVASFKVNDGALEVM
jgi:uncharacterized protein involved in type VI secretion and phage assembly